MSPTEPLRVAIVGAGPAAFYAASELLDARSVAVQVNMFERLPTPGGLVRAGVAPDHFDVKAISALFQRISARDGFRFYLNVDVGVDISHDDLAARHHAVIYANGASIDRRLGIPGESLPGSHSATEFVGWYNGHPDHSDHRFDLSCERAVVIGNGNVALDVARILLTDPKVLERTDIADHALAELRGSRIRQVTVVGRRDPRNAAFTAAELLALGGLPDVDIAVEAPSMPAPTAPRGHGGDIADYCASLKQRIVSEFALRPASGAPRRIALRFLASPVEILGSDAVQAVRVVRNELVRGGAGDTGAWATGETDIIEAGLVLRAIGHRGSPVPGVPFDDSTGTIPNDAGRVQEDCLGAILDGVYTTGWMKRGPSGVIGTNRKCAAETVRCLFEDYHHGRLAPPTAGDLSTAVATRCPDYVDSQGWKRIDLHEIRAGRDSGRPRVKLVRNADLLRTARGLD